MGSFFPLSWTINLNFYSWLLYSWYSLILYTPSLVLGLVWWSSSSSVIIDVASCLRLMKYFQSCIWNVLLVGYQNSRIDIFWSLSMSIFIFEIHRFKLAKPSCSSSINQLFILQSVHTTLSALEGSIDQILYFVGKGKTDCWETTLNLGSWNLFATRVRIPEY